MRERDRGWAAASCALSGRSLRFSRVPRAPRGLRPGSGVPALGPRLSRVPPPPRPPSAFFSASHCRGPGFPPRAPTLRAELNSRGPLATSGPAFPTPSAALRGPPRSPRPPRAFIPTSLASLELPVYFRSFSPPRIRPAAFGNHSGSRGRLLPCLGVPWE